jgi:hypothetical protein
MSEALQRRFGPGDWELLAPDASTRKFYRWRTSGGESLVVLQDREGGASAQERLVQAHALFERIGVPVPRLLDRDPALCAIVFEDFGDLLLADRLAQSAGSSGVELYRQAGAIAGRIAALSPAEWQQLPALLEPKLARQKLSFELEFFVQHELIARRLIQDESLLAEIRSMLQQLVELLVAQPRQFAHRDFHARNLMCRADARLGVVDFQDALEAPAHYDLASLVCDPYVQFDPAWQRAAEAGYGSAVIDDPAFQLVASQRLIKAIGTYARQVVELGRTRFLTSIPVAALRTRQQLDRLNDSFARSLSSLFDRAGLFSATI